MNLDNMTIDDLQDLLERDHDCGFNEHGEDGCACMEVRDKIEQLRVKEAKEAFNNAMILEAKEDQANNYISSYGSKNSGI